MWRASAVADVSRCAPPLPRPRARAGRRRSDDTVFAAARWRRRLFFRPRFDIALVLHAAERHVYGAPLEHPFRLLNQLQAEHLFPCQKLQDEALGRGESRNIHLVQLLSILHFVSQVESQNLNTMCFSARSTPSTRNPAGSIPQTTNPSFRRAPQPRPPCRSPQGAPVECHRHRARTGSPPRPAAVPSLRVDALPGHTSPTVPLCGGVSSGSIDGLPTAPISSGAKAPKIACSASASVSRTSSIDRKRSSPGELPNAYGSRSSASRRSSKYSAASAW